MSIHIATRGMFPGQPVSIATAGKFKSSLISRVVKAVKTFVSKPFNYLFITKNATEK